MCVHHTTKSVYPTLVARHFAVFFFFFFSTSRVPKKRVWVNDDFHFFEADRPSFSFARRTPSLSLSPHVGDMDVHR